MIWKIDSFQFSGARKFLGFDSFLPFELIAKFSESEDLEESEEVMVLSKNDIEVDTSGFIYEMINLAAPHINLCENPGETTSCDKEMLLKLKEFSLDNEEENNESNDPRWDALKSIKKN